MRAVAKCPQELLSTDHGDLQTILAFNGTSPNDLFQGQMPQGIVIWSQDREFLGRC